MDEDKKKEPPYRVMSKSIGANQRKPKLDQYEKQN